jgi:hypothetical protein
MPRGNRNTSDHCKFCDQPRYVLKSGELSSMCHKHLKESWRAGKAKNRQKNADYVPRYRKWDTSADSPQRNGDESRCQWCHLTPKLAAFAALNCDSWCYYCTWVDLSQDELLARCNGVPPVEGTSALLIDAEADELQQVKVIVTASEPLPQPAAMYKRVLAAIKDGVLVLRRHRITQEES